MYRDNNVVPFPTRHKNDAGVIAFDRRELGTILSMYGQLVAAGEWRDYTLDMAPDCATFSVYRRMGEAPTYRIEKRPKNAAKQGAYAIIGADGKILKRGHDLALVLRLFNRKLMRLADDG